MAIDFPASPTLNQQFSSGSSSWVWDGTAWNVVPQMTPATASDTPPANPAIGQLWWRASNGQMYIWYDDGNTKQWVQTSTAVAPVPGAWEQIYLGTFTCTSTVQFPVLNMGAFQKIKLTTDFKPGANDDTMYFQLSSDNGATWLTASQYTNVILRYLQLPSNGLDGAAAGGTQAGMMGGSSPTYGGISEFVLSQFNKPETTIWRGYSYGINTTNTSNLRMNAGVHSVAAAFNALRFFNALATACTVNMLIEGVRG